ncbi:hypothetical protein [Shewanella sp.]|uniref:hypothetical protein n=1 Tax=Shewanella sp. TaxID=50422 RepID=UPI004047A522
MMAYKRNLKSVLRKALMNAVTWAVFSAPIGAPILLDLWQLAVYPAVIGGLILFWIFLEHKSKTNPNNALGFIDDVGGMFFSLFFVGPGMLFAVVWTIYPLAHIDPLVLGTAYTLAIFTVLLLVLGSNIEDFAIRFFFKYRPKNNQPRK